MLKRLKALEKTLCNIYLMRDTDQDDIIDISKEVSVATDLNSMFKVLFALERMLVTWVF